MPSVRFYDDDNVLSKSYANCSSRATCCLQYLLEGLKGCHRGVMVKAMDCGIVVCEFVLQSRYYVHFRANTLEKGMNPLILPAMG